MRHFFTLLFVLVTLLFFLFAAQSAAWGQPPQSTPDPANSAAPANEWRYRWHNNHWWYWTPSDKWVIHDREAWVPYDPETYPMFYRRFNPAPAPLVLDRAYTNPVGIESYRVPLDGYDRVRDFGLRQDILNAGALRWNYGGYGSELGGYSGYRSSTGAQIGGGVGGSFGSGQGSYFGTGIGRGIGPRP
jgi:hypothetical protein